VAGTLTVPPWATRRCTKLDLGFHCLWRVCCSPQILVQVVKYRLRSVYVASTGLGHLQTDVESLPCSFARRGGAAPLKVSAGSCGVVAAFGGLIIDAL
jgi:hypothetical protein